MRSMTTLVDLVGVRVLCLLFLQMTAEEARAAAAATLDRAEDGPTEIDIE